MIEFKPDKYVAYEKIMKVIDSCETIDHLDGAKNMVRTFENTLPNTLLTSNNTYHSDNMIIKDLYSHLHIKRAILIG